MTDTAGATAGGALRIRAGAGDGVAMPAEEAVKHTGRVRDVLRTLISQMHDPELKSMLEDPRTVVEMSSSRREGDSREEELPLSLDDNWETVSRRLKEDVKELEIGLAKRHAGGRESAGVKVGRPGRLARTPRRVVVGAAHSHAPCAPFSSWTDVEELQRLGPGGRVARSGAASQS